MILKSQFFRVRQELVVSEKVVFVFTAMGTRLGHYGWFVKLLNSYGYSVVIYDYPTSLLRRPDFATWHDFYNQLAADVRERIAQLQIENRRHFYVYGVSVGSLIANKVTQDVSQISHVILNFTYGDLGTHLMLASATPKLRQAMRRYHISDEQLREQVAFMNPILTAAGLRRKKVLLNLAKRDRVLHFEELLRLRLAFDQARVPVQYSESRYLGHWAAGLKHMLNIKAIDQFYKS